MGILKRVDRTFEADYGFNAKNRDGYIVDLLCPETDNFTTMNAGADLEAVPMAGAEWLLAAPQFTQTVIAEDNAAWDATAAADDTHDALIVQVTGEAAKTVYWVAKVELVEVTG